MLRKSPMSVRQHDRCTFSFVILPCPVQYWPTGTDPESQNPFSHPPYPHLLYTTNTHTTVDRPRVLQAARCTFTMSVAGWHPQTMCRPTYTLHIHRMRWQFSLSPLNLFVRFVHEFTIRWFVFHVCGLS